MSTENLKEASVNSLEGRATKSLIEALLPPAVAAGIGNSPSTVPAAQTTGGPEHELRITRQVAGVAKVVLWHRVARVFSHPESGEVHQDTFNLGDAQKRERFTNACLKGLKGKLGEDKLEHLKKEIEEQLLWEWQSHEAKERWKESESKRSPAEKLRRKERNAGKSLLRSPSLLWGVGYWVERLGVVGETEKVQLLYLAITSRLMNKILSVAVKAHSASGKSYLTDSVLKLFPPDAYVSTSELSPKAL